jgi:hypothetical protein
MPLYKFKSNDIFHNTIKTHPRCEFFITSGNVYYNNRLAITGSHVDNTRHVPTGYISLYELNVDRADGNLIYPYVTKDGTMSSFKTATTSEFNSDFGYGDTMTGTYPLSASISRDFYTTSTRARIVALRNTLNHYKSTLSPYYKYSYYSTADVNLISIPSIFFGSSIKKGTVDLKFYVTGTLVGQLKDEKKDGELIQVGPAGSTGSGSVAGVVLYNEGFFALTGSWDLSGGNYVEDYDSDSTNETPQWIYFAATGMATDRIVSSSFAASFQGTNYVPTLTMFAHANRGELNHSNNPTFLDYVAFSGSQVPTTGSNQFVERKDISIKNIVKTPWIEPTGSFTKTTYISTIALYDEKKNLVGIAKLATPIKKTEDRDFTLKLKLDF